MYLRLGKLQEIMEKNTFLTLNPFFNGFQPNYLKNGLDIWIDVCLNNKNTQVYRQTRKNLVFFVSVGI